MIALHLLDPTTSHDALEMLATLMARSAGVRHECLVLGHRSTAARAIRAGVPQASLRYGRSLGWADPCGWRAVRNAIAALAPSHLHAWGFRGVVAASVQSGYMGPKLATFAVAPTERQMRLLRGAEARSGGMPWVWIGASTSVVRQLVTRGLPAERVVRIRPGVALAGASGQKPRALREQLGLEPDVGPVILLGGEGERAARQDHGLWAVAILQQMYPRTLVLMRLPEALETAHAEQLRRFAHTLPETSMVAEIPEDMPWGTAAQAADLFLVTPDAPIAVGGILWAMAAGVPVIGTATPEVSELVEHGHTGLLAKAGMPRSVAARLEAFMSDSTLRWPLTDRARADVFAHFKPGYMVGCFRAVYQQTLAGRAANIELPPPEMTAADRFAGVVDLG